MDIHFLIVWTEDKDGHISFLLMIISLVCVLFWREDLMTKLLSPEFLRRFVLVQ